LIVGCLTFQAYSDREQVQQWI